MYSFVEGSRVIVEEDHIFWGYRILFGRRTTYGGHNRFMRSAIEWPEPTWVEIAEGMEPPQECWLQISEEQALQLYKALAVHFGQEINIHVSVPSATPVSMGQSGVSVGEDGS